MTKEQRDYIINPFNETVVVDEHLTFCTEKNDIYIVFKF